MDQETRNQLARATQQLRRLLEDEFAEQLEGMFDILPDGRILPEPGKHLDARQRLTRQKLVDAIEHIKAAGKNAQEAVDEYTREAAFTFLNRFVALRMLEARGLLQECVSKGDQSSGFVEFCGLAPGLASLPDDGYRLYLECLFDELSVEIKVLFDRRDRVSLLWPRRGALTELLKILDQADLAGIWSEDETIGWVYQYFNSSEERKKMREESQAPRNSRELAVRNQFFTPRYVVEFLTDNTLGRIWYEMRKGQTRLVDECRYLVRRPNEVFLDEGQEPPADETESAQEQDLSQEELLKKTVYIPHRPKKDPRDLKMLDPACGSGHFLLYAFDLLITIYEEAWHDAASVESEVTGKRLHDEYAELDQLHPALPGLVLRHNLHGIDIDPRAVQIAALALWMRGQRAHYNARVFRERRPLIAKANIVCAEPMPGEASLLSEFIARELSGTPGTKLLGQLVQRVFEAMDLAGEAGSLLKIEEEISDALTEAKKQWASQPNQVQQALFVLEDDGPAQKQLDCEVAGITDTAFWEQAEQRIYSALSQYSQHADGAHYQRRLFSDDVALGFALIDLCRTKYDVILMNPPFGDASEVIGQTLNRLYPSWGSNLACAFMIRARELTVDKGFTGAILDNATAVRSTYGDFRRNEYLSSGNATLIAPFGWGVLDAYVETYGVVRAVRDDRTLNILGCDLKSVPIAEKAAELHAVFKTLHSPQLSELSIATVERLPNAVLDLSWPEFLVGSFARNPTLAEAGLPSYQGHALEAARHYRMYWELPIGTDLSGKGDWVMAFKGGDYSPGYLHDSWVALIGDRYRLVPSKSSNVLRNKELHLLGGVGYGKRGEFVDAQPLRSSSIFTHEGMAFVIEDESERWFLLALINSDYFNFGINKYCGQHKQSGYVNLFPCPDARTNEAERLRTSTERFVALKAKWFQRHETDFLFRGSPLLENSSRGCVAELIAHLEEEFQQDFAKLQDAWDTMNATINRVYGVNDEQ
ncbi:MAG: Eco57I restriction-modification methylase domain-containing protein, partial [Pirellulaceae bacterium]